LQTSGVAFNISHRSLLKTALPTLIFIIFNLGHFHYICLVWRSHSKLRTFKTHLHSNCLFLDADNSCHSWTFLFHFWLCYDWHIKEPSQVSTYFLLRPIGQQCKWQQHNFLNFAIFGHLMQPGLFNRKLALIKKDCPRTL
jgi:hypothetical protein